MKIVTIKKKFYLNRIQTTPQILDQTIEADFLKINS